jgi:lipoprotein Spr
MNRPVNIVNLCAVVLTVMLSVGMASCHSSKNNEKTKQSSAIENVDKNGKGKQKLDGTPKKVADALVSEARTWIGTPYKWGGHDKDGADCSGFLMEVFKSAVNVDIPRTTKDQRSTCIEVDRDNISVGDIIFFSSNNSGGKIAHVGMYVGDGRMIHASSSRGVVEDNLNLNYYVNHFNSIGRVPELAKANPVPKPVVAAEQTVAEVAPVRPTKMAETKPIALPKPTPKLDSVAEAVAQVKTDTLDIENKVASVVKNAFAPSKKK